MNALKLFFTIQLLLLSYSYSDALDFNVTEKGCYRDARDRDLNGVLIDYNRLMTPEKCFQACAIRGYQYAGLQYRRECHCGSNFGKHGQLPDYQCSCACLGDTNKECGCTWSNKVYEITGMQDTSAGIIYQGTATKKGCFRDEIFNRDLDGLWLYLASQMTPDNCIKQCARKNYKYAGLQQKGHCFCGNSHGKHGSLPEESCECSCYGDSTKNCGCSYAQIIYQLENKPTPCTQTGACGTGAICEVVDDKAVCSCPAGVIGDPNVRCCENTMKCGCWGDPHCKTFDGKKFDFMGTCKYDFVTTDCYNKTLPSVMKSFSVKQKQDKRNNRGVSFVEYIELEYNGNVYRLLNKRVSGNFKFTVNGLERPQPYDDVQGVKVFKHGRNLVMSADFGLTITFDGNSRAEVTLCDSYKNHVCGLCGNADGDNSVVNEFVDREDNPVPIEGPYITRFWKWGTSWKVPVYDDSVDQNGELCDKNIGPEPNVTQPECANPKLYGESYDFCAIMNHTLGPWAECLKYIDSQYLEEILEGCQFDLCVLENDPIQNDFRCKAYEQFNSVCLQLGDSLNKDWKFYWRIPSNCELNCGENKIYDIRSDCPKTCIHPDGNYDCGIPSKDEGCFCQDGYVLDTNGNCISTDKCGCELPDSVATLSVGDSFVSDDCTKLYKCLEPQTQPNVTNYQQCAYDATCTPINGEPACTCNDGFHGDGYACYEQCIPPRQDEPPCQSEYCFGYGDPHYTTIDGAHLNVNNTCSYILATDKCDGGEPSFSIIIDQEHRYNNGANYMKQIRIKYNNVEYTIGKKFAINGVETSLPYYQPTFEVYRENFYIVFNDNDFNIKFNGKSLLKLRVCKAECLNNCGLCRILNDGSAVYPFINNISTDRECNP